MPLVAAAPDTAAAVAAALPLLRCGWIPAAMPPVWCRRPCGGLRSVASVGSAAGGCGGGGLGRAGLGLGRQVLRSSTCQAPVLQRVAWMTPPSKVPVPNFLAARSRDSRGCSEFDLDRGKIIDTLKTDYPDFFERPPDFGIYDDGIVFDFGWPVASRVVVQGKQRYVWLLRLLQGFARRLISGGVVTCALSNHLVTGRREVVKVHWKCEGEFFKQSVRISANSMYTIGKSANMGQEPRMHHRVCRHTVEFLEIHPPRLKRALLSDPWAAPELAPHPLYLHEGRPF